MNSNNIKIVSKAVAQINIVKPVIKKNLLYSYIQDLHPTAYSAKDHPITLKPVADDDTYRMDIIFSSMLEPKRIDCIDVERAYLSGEERYITKYHHIRRMLECIYDNEFYKVDYTTLYNSDDDTNELNRISLKKFGVKTIDFDTYLEQDLGINPVQFNQENEELLYNYVVNEYDNEPHRFIYDLLYFYKL